MSVKNIAEYVFDNEDVDITVFSGDAYTNINTKDIEEDQLLLDFIDGHLDLCLDDGCYGFASDKLPLNVANLIGRKDGDRDRVGVYLFDSPVDLDIVPEELDVSIPIGVGWKYEVNADEFQSFDALMDACNDWNMEATNDAEDVSEPLPISNASPTETARGTDSSAEVSEEIAMMNDAELLGVDHPDMQELLKRPATFMKGNLWRQGDRRNTQDGDWRSIEMPWLAWIIGAAKGDEIGGKKVSQTWGFSRHPENARKEGDSVVLAEAIDGARTDSAIKTMHAVGLDIDSGAKLDDVLDRLEELGLFALVYTSHSHGKDRLTLKHDDVIRKLKLDESPNRTQIQQYLREHHKDRFDEDYIQSVEIEELRHQTKDGLRTILKTRPLDKFRVILPLWEPVELSSLGATVNNWKEVWADAVAGVGVNMLGVSFDSTCTDVNRLFYTPRHPKGAEYYAAVVQGRPLRFEEIEPYSKARYVKERDPGDPFAAGADLGTDGKREHFSLSGSNFDLNKWHKSHKTRFLLADVLISFCDDKIRTSGNEKVGTVHLECPFEHEHSTEGGTATMAMNPDENEAGYWTVFCRHDACAGRDKLEFIKEMVDEGWFDEALLKDDEWNIPLPDEDMEAEDDADATERPRTLLEQADQDFTEDSNEETIRKFLKKVAKMQPDRTDTSRIVSALANHTVLSKTDVRSILKAVSREVAASSNEESTETIPEIDWHFMDRVKWARERIHDVNMKSPRLFHYIEDVARISEDAKGRPQIKILNDKGFASTIDEFMKWHKVTFVGDAERRTEVPTPQDVVNHVYNGEHPYPYLRGLVSTPTFVEGGEMIITPGFHSNSGLYYWNANNLDVPKVSKVPTDEEVYEAKRLLIEEVFGDFPLGGLTRTELVEQALEGENGVPAVTHLISALLLLFCRDMIDGPTPGHLITKPSPGTGASLLAEILSMIAYGQAATAKHLPTNNEEMQKTLLTTIRDGDNIIYFDNIDQSVDSGVFASYLTAREVSGRVLGKTQSVTAEVRAVWLLCGNNVRLSKELLRRLLMIDLDANMANPEKRTDFRHKSVTKYVMETRGELVWACLTLIQNWVAKGMKEQDDIILNSFEEWSRVMGGILRDAGLGGFLTNLDELQERASDGDDDDIQQFLNIWWETYLNTPTTARSSDPKEPSLISMAMAHDIQLPIRKTKNADDEVVYDVKAFNKFLGVYEGRVMALSDGTEVKVLKTNPHGKTGYNWKLEVVHTSGVV